MGRERLGHKTELHHRTHVRGRVGIKNLIEDGPAVDRVPVRILGVDVRRAPFEIGLSVAGGEQEMGADINRNRAQIVQLGKQGLAVLRDRIARFVVAKPAIDGREFACGFRQVHVDTNGVCARQNNVASRRLNRKRYRRVHRRKCSLSLVINL